MSIEQQYWKERYANRVPSSRGQGIGEIRAVIWSFLEAHVPDWAELDILDVGSGDGEFWKARSLKEGEKSGDCPLNYMGVDYAIDWYPPRVIIGDACVDGLPMSDLSFLIAVLFHSSSPDLLLRKVLEVSRKYILLTAHLEPVLGDVCFWYTPMPDPPEGWVEVARQALPDPRVGVALWRRV